jgi:TonB family protein
MLWLTPIATLSRDTPQSNQSDEANSESIHEQAGSISKAVRRHCHDILPWLVFFSLGLMRTAFCLTIILLSAPIAHAGKPQPTGTPARVIFTPADTRRVSAYTPRPVYPAIGRRIRGSGIFRLYVSLQTGLVNSTQVEQSTGYESLDTAAIDTLKRWRFKPDTLRRYFDPHKRSDAVVLRVPVTFGGRRT